jgi:hypothetical protein
MVERNSPDKQNKPGYFSATAKPVIASAFHVDFASDLAGFVDRQISEMLH